MRLPLFPGVSLLLASGYCRDITVELSHWNDETLEGLESMAGKRTRTLTQSTMELKDLVLFNQQKFKQISRSFAVLPSDDASVLVSELQDRAFKLGMTVDVPALANQVENFGSSSSQITLATVSTSAPVPFSFYRLETSSSTADALVEHVNICIVNARSGLSRLLGRPEVLQVKGMSDSSVRHLLNNLASASGTNYLEVGSWRGSTFVSALANNEYTVDNALAVDTWAHAQNETQVFGTGEESLAAFEANVARFVSDGPSWLHMQRDFRTLRDLTFRTQGHAYDPPGPIKFNVYFFDGPHEALDHEAALVSVLLHLSRTFVYLVDDWNYLPVQEGTFKAVVSLGLEVIWAETLGGGRPNGHTGPWHNGLWVAVLHQP
mmetsp:Transcript_24343/g.54892  ORF Transcript_24343/g.54892 Transcript_24343/m.54892 type:complete len:377 (+) Transcript_24343:39-1169(+)